MKVRYTAPKGRRCKKNIFFEVTTFDGYWFVKEEKKWINKNTANGERSTHFWGVRSVKAFVHYLRKWSKYLPKNVEFILCTRYQKHLVYGRTCGNSSAVTDK